MRGRLRLTWLELGIVAVTLGVGATVAGAGLASRRIRAREASAVATLRYIAAAQAEFQALALADADANGVGEFGVFREMAGVIAVRTASTGTNTGGTLLQPALLPSKFGRLNANAEVRHGGYLFKVFIPSWGGAASEETATGMTDTLSSDVSSFLCSASWCVYAWPARYGRSGRHTFFLNQDGVVSRTDTSRYSGSGEIDTATAGAAFVSAQGWHGSITGTQALGTVGRDGNFWRAVE